MGESLGENSYENSSRLLISQRQEELVHIAQDNAAIINHRMLDISRSVQGVAREAEEIERYPQRFLPQEVNIPTPANYRSLYLYLQYGPEVSPEAYQKHISMMANIGDLLARTIECNDMAESVFITAKDNFTLSVDAPRVLAEDKSDIPKPHYDAVGSDWYKRAAGKDGLVFTPVRRFMFNKKLGMFCSVPYYGTDGKDYYIAFAPIEGTGWSFAAAFAADDVIAPALQNKAGIAQVTKEKTSLMQQKMSLIIFLMVVFIAVLLVVFVYSGRKLSRQFVAPIHELADGVREITSGNLSKKVEIRTGDEIEHLAVCFNAMTDELQTYMKKLTAATAEKERIATELSVARDIRLGALPQDFLQDKPSIQLYATMSAAKEVGGDFYDFYMLDENHLVLAMADVSGKGVPAALFMMRAKTTLKNLVLMARVPDDFAAVMTLANRELCQDNEEMMFVTVFLAQLDLTTGEMLFLYTDGVTEAMAVDKKLYSEERLQKTLDSIDRKASVREILAAVRKDISVHAEGAEQSDDITMLGLMYCGK